MTCYSHLISCCNSTLKLIILLRSERCAACRSSSNSSLWLLPCGLFTPHTHCHLNATKQQQQEIFCSQPKMSCSSEVHFCCCMTCFPHCNKYEVYPFNHAGVLKLSAFLILLQRYPLTHSMVMMLLATTAADRISWSEGFFLGISLIFPPYSSFQLPYLTHQCGSVNPT